MVGVAAWIALLALAIALEVGSRRGARWPTLGALATVIWSRPLGRLVLIALWLFVGLHLFARYTVPR